MSKHDSVVLNVQMHAKDMTIKQMTEESRSKGRAVHVSPTDGYIATCDYLLARLREMKDWQADKEVPF